MIVVGRRFQTVRVVLGSGEWLHQFRLITGGLAVRVLQVGVVEERMIRTVLDQLRASTVVFHLEGELFGRVRYRG